MIILFLALSVSLDSLGIGVSYGIKKVKISTPSLLIIVSITLAVLAATWLAGQILLTWISVQLAHYISSILFVGMGITMMVQAFRERTIRPVEKPSPKLSIKGPLDAMVKIIKAPASSDIDDSGSIDYKEAFYLGIALSVDAFSIGLVSAAYGASLPLFLTATGCINFLLLRVGEHLGRKSSRLIPEGKLKMVSGSIVLAMGLIKLLSV